MKKGGYLSYEVLTSDFVSDGRYTNLSNQDKGWKYLVLRTTDYFKTIYNVPLDPGEMVGWKMYEIQIPETQRALTFIMNNIIEQQEPDTQALLFLQLVNGLLHCPIGQAEGINSMACTILEGSYHNREFGSLVNTILAVKKNAAFTQCILTHGVDSSQNVHLMSVYRTQLKDELGGQAAAIGSYQEAWDFWAKILSRITNRMRLKPFMICLRLHALLIGWLK